MNVQTISVSTFDAAVRQEGIVVVDFWATWCGPCKALAPVLEDVAEEYAGRVAVYKANVEEEAELAARHRVMAVPTLVFYRDGEKVKTVSGGRSRDDLDALLQEVSA